MQLGIYQSKLFDAIKRKNLFLGFSLLLGLTVCLQSFIIWSLANDEKIILVPPQLEQSVWLKGNEVSSNYLEQMSLFFTNLALNLTPDNADFMHQKILRLVDPKIYSELKAKLASDARELKQRNITTTFYPVNFAINKTKHQVDITGDFETQVGKTQTSLVRRTYRVRFNNHQGQWFISEFRELKDNEIN